MNGYALRPVEYISFLEGFLGLREGFSVVLHSALAIRRGLLALRDYLEKTQITSGSSAMLKDLAGALEHFEKTRSDSRRAFAILALVDFFLYRRQTNIIQGLIEDLYQVAMAQDDPRGDFGSFYAYLKKRA